MKNLAIAFEGIFYTDNFAIEHLTYILILLWLMIIIFISLLFVKFYVYKRNI